MNFSVPSRQMPRFFVQRGRVAHQLVPGFDRLRIDLDHAWVGRDLELVQAGVVRRRVTFDQHGQSQLGGGVLDGRDQFDIVLRCRAAA